MANKDKYIYIPLAVVIFCGFGLALFCRYVAMKHEVDTGTSNLIFIFVLAGFILAYLLFSVLWEPLSHKFLGKRFIPKPHYRPDLPEDSKLQDKIESFCRYSDQILNGYIAKEDMERLHIYISQYAQNNTDDIPHKINTTGLDKFELYHYGWNIWNHFDITGQEETADWLINVFSLLKGSDRSIVKKFKHNERRIYKIPIEPNIK
jgi:hypothetical protein